MRIQLSTDYAMRILQHLHRNKHDIHTAMSIAEATRMTYPFFIKIANQLKTHGLVSSVQGRNGGYYLGRPAHTISFYDVFLAMEGELQINRCLQDDQFCSKCDPKDCKMYEFLYSLQKKMILELSSQTVADLAA